MIGRGLLGKWGPNHAADPVVTRLLTACIISLCISSLTCMRLCVVRWKRDEGGNQLLNNGKPILEFVAIKRRDNGEWAIPGVRGPRDLKHLYTYVVYYIFMFV